MPNVLVTATLDPASGFDQEAAQNSFAFASDVAISPGVILDIHNAVASFYQEIGIYLSSRLSRAAGDCTLKMYDVTNHLDGSPHGSPIADDAFTLPASAVSDNLPTQVAACLTLRARGALDQPVEGPGDIRPRQRFSGRLFVGPLNEDPRDSSAGDGSYLKQGFVDAVLLAAENLQDALVDGDYAWCVWSRARADMVPITRVEMDNSFDVIRSRQLAPTLRTARTFAPAPSLILGA